MVPNDEYFSQTTSPSGDKASHIYQQFAPSLPEVVTYDVQMSEKARQLASMSPGLQSVMDDEGFKEALPPLPGYQSHVLEQNPPLEYMHTGEKTAQKTRICGISTTKFYILLAAVILLVLGAALGIGLGLGLSTDNESVLFAHGKRFLLNLAQIIDSIRRPFQQRRRRLPHRRSIRCILLFQVRRLQRLRNCSGVTIVRRSGRLRNTWRDSDVLSTPFRRDSIHPARQRRSMAGRQRL